VNQIEFHPFIYKDQKPALWHNRAAKQYSRGGLQSGLAHGRHVNDKTVGNIASQHKVTSAQAYAGLAIGHGTIPILKKQPISASHETKL